MDGMRMWGAVVIVALTAFGVDTPEARAQSSQVKAPEVQAEQMERQAAQMLDDIDNVKKAAKLYRNAAELRGSHPDAVHSLVMAGTLAFYHGDERQSVRDLTKAGDTALEWGDVVAAAKAFLDAAWVANKDGEGQTAIDLVHRAQRLSQSPLIAQAERREIEARIVAQQQQVPQQ